MAALIGCRDAVARLWEFLDRELPETDHLAVEQHLAFCRRCCGELAFARELRGLLATSTGEMLPEEVRGRLEDVIECLDEIDGTADEGYDHER